MHMKRFNKDKRLKVLLLLMAFFLIFSANISINIKLVVNVIDLFV